MVENLYVEANQFALVRIYMPTICACMTIYGSAILNVFIAVQVLANVFTD